MHVYKLKLFKLLYRQYPSWLPNVRIDNFYIYTYVREQALVTFPVQIFTLHVMECSVLGIRTTYLINEEIQY